MRTDRTYGGRGERVAVVNPQGNLDSVPSLCSTVVLLAERGYWVDVFTQDIPHYMPPEFKEGRIAVLPLRRPVAGSRRTVWGWMPEFLYLPLLIRARHRRIPYKCIIGVDSEGLVEAASLAQHVKAPLVYYSLELMFERELKTDLQKELKRRERMLSQKAAFTIIQDDERAAALARENGLPHDRIICVPNAPLGKACRKTSSCLREKYRLSPETKIILNAGSLDTWAGAHELIWSTREWPEDWILVCHTRYSQWHLDGQYFKALQCMARSGRVIFSTEPVDRETYPEIVRSADVGVAFYVPQDNTPAVGDNLRLLGLSSGKLAYYLQAGIPVLVNEVASLRRLVTKYRCGEVARDTGSTVEALRNIFNNYDVRSLGAVQCFDMEWDFHQAFAKVLDAMKSRLA